jgi:hypothetical protein
MKRVSFGLFRDKVMGRVGILLSQGLLDGDEPGGVQQRAALREQIPKQSGCESAEPATVIRVTECTEILADAVLSVAMESGPPECEVIPEAPSHSLGEKWTLLYVRPLRCRLQGRGFLEETDGTSQELSDRLLSLGYGTAHPGSGGGQCSL